MYKTTPKIRSHKHISLYVCTFIVTHRARWQGSPPPSGRAACCCRSSGPGNSNRTGTRGGATSCTADNRLTAP